MHNGPDRIGTHYTTGSPAHTLPRPTVSGQNNPAQPLSILHLEDDADDAALTEILLRRGGLLCSIVRVVDRDEFVDAIGKGGIDIILSDLTLPRFSGMEALTITRECCPELPFIFLSGNIGEETAIETLLHGARDYVLKQRMQRLLPAIQRVLHETEESRKRIKAETEVRRMQNWANHMSDIVSRSPVVAFTWTIDPGWPVTFVSDNVAQFGYAPSDFLLDGLLYSEIIHPDDLQNVQVLVKKFIESSDTDVSMEYRILSKGGQIIWLEDHTKATRDSTNAIVTLDGVVIDITERKLHEIEQELNASRMAKLYELASMESLGERTLVDNVLEHAVRLTGSCIGYVHFFESDNAIPTKSHWTSNIPENCRTTHATCDLISRMRPIWHDCFVSQSSVILNAVDDPTSPCGSTETTAILTRQAAVPIVVDGVVVMIVGVASKGEAYNDSDIRMLQLMMIELWRLLKRERERAELKKYWRAVEQSPVAIAVTDMSGIIEYANPKLHDLTGYDPDEVIGMHTSVFRSGEHEEAFYQNLWSTVLSGARWNGTLRNKRKDGTLYWEEMSISPVSDDSGTILNFVAIKEDVSRRVEMEEARLLAQAETERASKLKDHFIALISHEIRTPLNVIFGYSSLIREIYSELIEPLDRYMFESIEDAGKRLMRTVDLLLAASSLGAGAYTPIIEEFDALAAIERLLQQYYHTAHQKALHLEYHCHEKEVNVRIDRFGFEQVLQNLIDNALKFTEKGGVFISTAIEGNNIRIDVRDTGRGMSQDFVERSFHLFTQEAEGYSRPYEGLGLGLALVKKYIEINGGHIAVHSEQGQGSVFSVYFPLPE